MKEAPLGVNLSGPVSSNRMSRIQQSLVSASVQSRQIFDGAGYPVSTVSRLACHVVLGMACQHAMFAVSRRPCQTQRPCRQSQAGRLGNQKIIPSRWFRCGLLYNGLNRVSRVSLQGHVSRVMWIISAVSGMRGSVVMRMSIVSSCRV